MISVVGDLIELHRVWHSKNTFLGDGYTDAVVNVL